jgi:DNA repair photolyase
MARVRIELADARGILTRTGGYLAGYTHTLQPYAGCQFSCRYCYVRELPVQRANRFGLPWSAWLVVKRNAPELLAREAACGRLSAARIFMSSATDPYTPAERRYRVTRGCLEVMASRPPRAIVVQTRSPLVLRDLDLLARIPRLAVSFTVPTSDESMRRLLEPDSPKLARRVATLAALKAAGLRVQAAIAPLLPGDVRALACALAPHVDRVVLDDFFRGDGAGGRRSVAAREVLAGAGYAAFAEPGYARQAAHTLREVLGPERVVESQAGFNDLAWLDRSPRRGPGAACAQCEPIESTKT